jgi:hypothetical protein
MVSTQDMSINISLFLEFIKKRNTPYFLVLSDTYKAYEDELLRIEMSISVSPSTPSLTHYDNTDNTTALLYLVALFYEKGDISAATKLLKSFHKED